MANDVTTKNAALPPALIQKIAEGLTRAYGGHDHAVRTGLPILKLDRGGKGWSYGQDNTAVETGTLALVQTGTFQHGVVVWSDRTKVFEEMVEGWQDAPPIPMTSHPTGQPYKRQSQVKLTLLDDGTEVLYVISSDGGNERLAELGRIAGARIGQYAQTSAYLYPVVALDMDYYDNKQHGSRIYKPVFDIVGWADAEGNMEEGAGNVTALKPPAPLPEPPKQAKDERPHRPASPPWPRIKPNSNAGACPRRLF